MASLNGICCGLTETTEPVIRRAINDGFDVTAYVPTYESDDSDDNICHLATFRKGNVADLAQWLAEHPKAETYAFKGDNAQRGEADVLPFPSGHAGAEAPGNLDVVLRYAAAAFSVFPCNAEKRPLVKWRDESTMDDSVIREWWRRWPDAIVGIDLSKSGLVASTQRHPIRGVVKVASIVKSCILQLLTVLAAPMTLVFRFCFGSKTSNPV
jgi:hypothetical protein